MVVPSGGSRGRKACSMCTSRVRAADRRGAQGFTVLELLVGMALTVGLAMTVSPLVLSSQQAGLRDADRVVMMMQGRVAAARFEKDLRSATAVDCSFHATGPVLQATPGQLVILGRGDEQSECRMIEWEIDGGRLMRRWGPCPPTRPGEYSHSLYADHKTMVAGLSGDACLSYLVDGTMVYGSVPPNSLAYVEGVMLTGSGVDSYGDWKTALWVGSGVGR